MPKLHIPQPYIAVPFILPGHRSQHLPWFWNSCTRWPFPQYTLLPPSLPRAPGTALPWSPAAKFKIPTSISLMKRGVAMRDYYLSPPSPYYKWPGHAGLPPSLGKFSHLICRLLYSNIQGYECCKRVAEFIS